ncbi:MAG TPA: excinuclease ABC subunit UvrC [Armatimonadota bacterium]|nr:excinuclease ABC subunit UvrC [Armatimonadota bacterium]
MPLTATLDEKIEELPDLPGVYLYKDVSGDVLYVGKAQSLRSRVRSYFQPSADLEPRKQLMIDQVRDLDFVVLESEREALILEFTLIQKHRPRYNVRYRDDKSYPYIRIDPRDEYPALCVVRQRAVARDGARYFGPYLSTRAMWQTIRLLRRVFGLCQRAIVSAKRRSGCTWTPAKGPRKRPCLDYHLGQCLGPCVGAVTPEEYQQVAAQVCDFLDGRYDHVLAQLRKQMERAAADMRFEAAGNLRDQIESLEATVSRQRVVSPAGGDADALGYALREDTACMAVLQIREGRVVGQDNHLLNGVSGVSAAEVVNEFAKLYYQKVADAPREVLLPIGIDDADTLAGLLGERRGARVRVFAPKRGAKKDLVSMAMENAAQHLRTILERESAERRRGEEAVSDLQKVLSLPVPPHRIEAFDISNVSGTQAVGSMIVFQDGQPKKSEYRRFRIRLSEGQPNDYEMMREILSRRLKAAVSGNVKFQHLPDLLLVDGGPGQLAVAAKAMEELELRMPAAGLAKEHEHVYIPGRRAAISLPAHSRALHLLQRLRDEAHRFALSYHRSLRARRARESVLDEIPGIGPTRKQKLIRRFGTIGRLRAASAEQIAEAAGCSREVAAAVVNHLRASESD